AGLSDAELADRVRGLEHAQRRLGAAVASTLAAFEARQVQVSDGQRSVASWMAKECNTDRNQSARELRRARALRHMPRVAEAFGSGELTATHVDLLARARRVSPPAFARDEAMLVGYAIDLEFAEFRRAVDYWRQLAEPDDAEDHATRLWQQRNLHASTTVDGAVVINGLLDPVAGAAFVAELDRLERAMFEQDWAEAKKRVGDPVRAQDLARTSAQRRADALVEMAHRSRSTPPGANRPRPLVTVLVDYPTLAGRVCELSTGTVITPGQLLGVIERADIERAVFDGPSRVVDVGTTRRLYRGGTRRAVEVTDQHCTERGCDEPAEHCDVDHEIPWPAGPTTQANGRLRCPDHHPNRKRPPPPPCDDDPP
ncbi:MAG: DUF222 domain-containing protein, partial [Acidimicrobiales bacterium]